MDQLAQTQQAYFQILGNGFSTPLANDPNDHVAAYLFATRQDYIDYMGAFIGCCDQAGGVYLENWQNVARLFTYFRNPWESYYSTSNLLRHEFTHYLNGRYLFPGFISDPGYHDQPKQWLDEGLAEFFGLMTLDGNGGFATPL